MSEKYFSLKFSLAKLVKHVKEAQAWKRFGTHKNVKILTLNEHENYYVQLL